MKQNRFDRNGRQSYSSVEQSIPYISGLHSLGQKPALEEGLNQGLNGLH